MVDDSPSSTPDACLSRAVRRARDTSPLYKCEVDWRPEAVPLPQNAWNAALWCARCVNKSLAPTSRGALVEKVPTGEPFVWRRPYPPEGRLAWISSKKGPFSRFVHGMAGDLRTSGGRVVDCLRSRSPVLLELVPGGVGEPRGNDYFARVDGVCEGASVTVAMVPQSASTRRSRGCSSRVCSVPSHTSFVGAYLDARTCPAMMSILKA